MSMTIRPKHIRLITLRVSNLIPITLLSSKPSRFRDIFDSLLVAVRQRFGQDLRAPYVHVPCRCDKFVHCRHVARARECIICHHSDVLRAELPRMRQVIRLQDGVMRKYRAFVLTIPAPIDDDFFCGDERQCRLGGKIGALIHRQDKIRFVLAAPVAASFLHRVCPVRLFILLYRGQCQARLRICDIVHRRQIGRQIVMSDCLKSMFFIKIIKINHYSRFC